MKTELRLRSDNVHQVVMAAFVVAVKVCDDEYLSNTHYGVIGSYSTRYMNVLEQEFLTRIDWESYISTSDFEMYADEMSAAEAVDRIAQDDVTVLPSPSVGVDKPPRSPTLDPLVALLQSSQF